MSLSPKLTFPEKDESFVPFTSKVPAITVFPLAAATVNLFVFTAKSPVELKLVFVLNEPSTVIAVPDSETIESAITLVDDHLVKLPVVPVPSTWL